MLIDVVGAVRTRSTAGGGPPPTGGERDFTASTAGYVGPRQHRHSSARDG
jgi:hypothetical protein